MKLEPGDFAVEVARVLRTVAMGPEPAGRFLTAYQIFWRLPEWLRLRLAHERGPMPQGTAIHECVALVSEAAELIPGVEASFLDATGFVFFMSESAVPIVDQRLGTGAPVCGIYRLRSAGD